MAHDVFISYSSQDKVVADAVCGVLERNAVRCWIAPRDVAPGMDYAACLVEAIERARVFVLVFSENSNASPQVLREVERAVSKGLPVLPFRIEDVQPTKSMEFFLSSPHWLDALTPPMERHLEKLVRGVRGLLDADAGGDGGGMAAGAAAPVVAAKSGKGFRVGLSVALVGLLAVAGVGWTQGWFGGGAAEEARPEVVAAPGVPEEARGAEAEAEAEPEPEPARSPEPAVVVAEEAAPDATTEVMEADEKVAEPVKATAVGVFDVGEVWWAEDNRVPGIFTVEAVKGGVFSGRIAWPLQGTEVFPYEGRVEGDKVRLAADDPDELEPVVTEGTLKGESVFVDYGRIFRPVVFEDIGLVPGMIFKELRGTDDDKREEWVLRVDAVDEGRFNGRAWETILANMVAGRPLGGVLFGGVLILETEGSDGRPRFGAIWRRDGKVAGQSLCANAVQTQLYAIDQRPALDVAPGDSWRCLRRDAEAAPGGDTVVVLTVKAVADDGGVVFGWDQPETPRFEGFELTGSRAGRHVFLTGRGGWGKHEVHLDFRPGELYGFAYIQGGKYWLRAPLSD